MKRFLLFILLFIISCGYHFSLTDARRGKMPSKPLGIENIYIQLFKNHTSERGLETLFLNALVYEFNTRKGFKLVDKQQAHAFLSGELTGYKITGIAYTKGEYTATGRVSLTIKAILRNKEGKVLWQKTLYEQEEYHVANSPSETRDNRQNALERILKRLAERIYEGLIIGM